VPPRGLPAGGWATEASDAAQPFRHRYLTGSAEGLASAQALVEAAQKAMLQIGMIESTLGEAYTDLVQLEFEGRDALEADRGRAYQAIGEATSALSRVATFELPEGSTVRWRDVFQIVVDRDEAQS
jgi:hypothetical protein